MKEINTETFNLSLANASVEIKMLISSDILYESIENQAKQLTGIEGLADKLLMPIGYYALGLISNRELEDEVQTISNFNALQFATTVIENATLAIKKKNLEETELKLKLSNQNSVLPTQDREVINQQINSSVQEISPEPNMYVSTQDSVLNQPPQNPPPSNDAARWGQV